MHHLTDRIAHTMASVTPIMEQEITQWEKEIEGIYFDVSIQKYINNFKKIIIIISSKLLQILR